MKMKFDLADRAQVTLVFHAIAGAWPDLMGTVAVPAPAPVTAAPVAVAAAPVPVPVADKPAPVAETAPVVAETPAPVDTKPEPVAETPAPVAPAKGGATLDALIAGRALTKSLKVADGGVVRPGEEVYLRDGTLMVVEVTMRGMAVCFDETQIFTLHDASTLYSTLAAAEAVPAPAAVAAPAPVADAPPAADAPAAPAQVVNGAVSELPADYLLAELNTAGNAVKKAHSVAKVLELLAQVSPGTMRLSELPLPKRQPLLEAFKQALAA